MKLSKLIFILIVLCCSLSAKAQYVNSGNEQISDSIECLQNISVYKEFLKLNLMDRALNSWRLTYKTCKGFKKSIYIDGAKVYTYLIENEKDVGKRKSITDTLINLYNERISYFGQEGYLSGIKGLTLLRYDKDRLQEAHDCLQKSFDLEKNATEAAVIASFMNTSTNLYKMEKIQQDEFINNYLKCVETLENQIKNEKKADELKTRQMALEAVEKMFSTNVPDCKGLVDAFSPVFEEKKEEIDQVLKIQKLLKGGGCVDEELYLNVALQIHKLQPGASNTELLAALYLKKEDYNQAIDYLKQAVNLQDVDSIKATYYHDLGFIYCHKLKQYAQARTYAYEAIKYRPNWGNPYILIGDAYAASSGSFSDSPFTNSTVYWAAVDKYYKAKAVDPEVEKVANQRITYYSNYFPNKEDAFMQGCTEGNAYKVEGWINENTKVRVK